MNRRYLFYFFFVSIALIFIARLFHIQVIKNEYKLSAENNIIRKKKVYPGRGFIFDRNGKLLVGNEPTYDLMVVPRLVKDIDTIKFCNLIDISAEDFKSRMIKAKDYSRIKSSIFLKQISREKFAGFWEKLHLFAGFYPQKKILRSYQYNSAANVTGYIGEVSDIFLKNNPRYEKGDLIGITGIEKSHEEFLRGKFGVQYKMIDVHGQVKAPYQHGGYDILSKPGSSITSSINIDLQQYGEALMSDKRGSIVAMEPSSGEILSLITSPTYNPKLMVGSKRLYNYNKLYTDTIGKPLYDRSLLAEYSPGSPFKMINALIGLQEGTLTENTTYTCYNGFHYRKLHVACHCGTNYPVSLRTSISKSCNNFYCNVFKSIIEKYSTAQKGMNVWNLHVKSFGLGQFLNNDLAIGRKGLVPDASYYDNSFGYRNWKAVSVISLGVGQGELLVTPIQLANVAAIIANRGYYYTPHIVKKIEDDGLKDEKYIEPKYTTIDSVHFEKIIEGMFDVFEKGTARWSKHDSIPMAGKTGTVENSHGQDHSIFIAFAPLDKPKIAIATIVENGYWGSRWAAPISSLMIEKYLTGKISRKKMENRMLQGSLRKEYEKQLLRKM